MKVLLITSVVIGSYILLVFVPNSIERNSYRTCAAESITKTEAARFNYGGNVRDDSTRPKTCSDNNGTETFEDRNLFIPGFLQ